MDAQPLTHPSSPRDPLDRVRPPVRPGDRLTVRHRLPDGSATDVVGWLERHDAEQVVLHDLAGVAVVVGRDRIVAARRAPAARGGPGPMRTSADELEQVALPGWAALREPLGEWTLRAGGGFTGRANSCLAVGDPGVPVAEAADRIVAFSLDHGIAARAQVVVGSAQDQALQDLGWRETYVRTDVLAARLADLLGDRHADPRVHVSEALSEPWWQAYQASRAITAPRVANPLDPGADPPADPQVVRQILEGQPPRAFAGVGADACWAIGRGHLCADWLGVASLWTAPAHRQQGWATQVLVALGHWGARRGARNVYLQVATDNALAHEAYARLGFAPHHSYRYLGPAASDDTDSGAGERDPKGSAASE